MSYVRTSGGRKTPYEKKHSRKNKMQEEWILEKTALDSSAEQVSDLNTILEQFEAKSEEGRRCALRNLIRVSRNRLCSEDDLDTSKKLLVQHLIRCIHGPSSVALLAFDAIEVLAVVYGSDDDYLEGILEPVRAMALTAAPQKLEEEQQQVIGAAMRTLGSLCFFCCDDDDKLVDLIKSIDSVVTVEPKNASQPVVAAALGAWELVHTRTEFSDEYHERMTAAIWSHLKSSKSGVDTRIAAGRALGFSFQRISDDGDTIENHRKWIPDSERLTEVINECAFGTTHPKHDRTKEQPLFKILASWMLEGEELPAVTITINGSKVLFETWNILARLTVVKRILGSGLQQHLMENTILPSVLEYEVPDKEAKRRMSEAEKKYARHVANMADKAKTERMKSRMSSGSFFDDEDD